MADLVDGVIELDDVHLHYVEAGTGPLIVLYHGFPSYWFSFHHQLEDLARDHHVVAVDGPGANLSSKPADLAPYRLPRLADQLDALARDRGGDAPFVLVGHDWGGALAWSYAQRHPDRLRGVVVLSAPPTNQLLELLATDPDQQARSSYMYDLRDGDLHRRLTEDGGRRMWRFAYEPLRALPHFLPDHDERFRQALAQPGAVDCGINWYRANVPPPEQITDADHWPSPDAATDVPALLVWGDDDGTFVPRFIDELGRYATDLEVHRMAGTRHWPMLEHPDEVNAAIRRFLVERAR